MRTIQDLVISYTAALAEEIYKMKPMLVVINENANPKNPKHMEKSKICTIGSKNINFTYGHIPTIVFMGPKYSNDYWVIYNEWRSYIKKNQRGYDFEHWWYNTVLQEILYSITCLGIGKNNPGFDDELGKNGDISASFETSFIEELQKITWRKNGKKYKIDPLKEDNDD